MSPPNFGASISCLHFIPLPSISYLHLISVQASHVSLTKDVTQDTPNDTHHNDNVSIWLISEERCRDRKPLILILKSLCILDHTSYAEISYLRFSHWAAGFKKHCFDHVPDTQGVSVFLRILARSLFTDSPLSVGSVNQKQTSFEKIRHNRWVPKLSQLILVPPMLTWKVDFCSYLIHF